MNADENRQTYGFPRVSVPESGQKLLQLLERRLELPPALLHRWIRTGQIRINGKRCKPFDRVYEGNIIRVPPFACRLSQMRLDAVSPSQAALANLFPIIGHKDAIWAIDKPAGLPTQPGTGHSDSVVDRLEAAFPDASFKPAPAHRLDRDTSGVLALASTFEALRYLQDNFRMGNIAKEYLAWVDGQWPWPEDILIRHFLRKEGEPGKVRMRAHDVSVPYSHEALSVTRPLAVKDDASLVHVRLLTGRTHQIRAQLAALGFPLCGDSRYGGKKGQFRLHALRMILPDGHEFLAPPPWPSDFSPAAMPEPFPGGPAADFSNLPKPAIRSANPKI